MPVWELTSPVIGSTRWPNCDGDGILAGILALSTSQRDTFQHFTVQYTTDFVSQFGVLFLIYLGLVVRGNGGGALGNGEFSSSGVGIQLVVGVGDGCRDGVSTCLGGRCSAIVLGAIVGCAGVGKRYRNIFPFHSAGKISSGGDDTAVSAAVRGSGATSAPKQTRIKKPPKFMNFRCSEYAIQSR